LSSFRPLLNLQEAGVNGRHPDRVISPGQGENATSGWSTSAWSVATITMPPCRHI
jgi:hypothetical protein